MRVASSLLTAGLAAAVLTHGEAGAQRVRCGTRTTAPCTAPGLTFLSVSAGFTHSCGVSQDGSAWCWGDGREGALGDGQRLVQRLPRRVMSTTTFVEVGAGGAYSCARSVDDAVYCWGNAQTVPGWPEVSVTPVRVPTDRPTASIAIGRRHACLLDREGAARCWGWNVDGETGIGESGTVASMVARPTPVATDERFSVLSAGMGFTCGVTRAGAVLCWGSNVDWVLGPEAPETCGDVPRVPCATRPVPIALPERARHVSSGNGHACAVSVGGTVYCWGTNRAGQVGAYSAAVSMVRSPTAVTVPWSGRFVEVASGGIHTCARAESMKVYCWGADQLNYGDDIDPLAVAPRLAAAGTQFKSISAGLVHLCGLDTQGRLLCWGDSIHGALGGR